MNMRHYQIAARHRVQVEREAARYRVQVEREAALEQAAIAAPEPRPIEEYRAAVSGFEAEMARIEKFPVAFMAITSVFAVIAIALGWLL